METTTIMLLILAMLIGLGYAGYVWAKRRTTVRSDLVDLDRQEDAYRYGFLDRLGRRVKMVKTRWLKRRKA
ncbi:hypothetical protein [uncultured Fibrella sp.]|uniref:hypothetical protein n=1 Tax=uncultured Fibrella sp. TaxID=1284596 RepID=UPI0035CA612F